MRLLIVNVGTGDVGRCLRRWFGRRNPDNIWGWGRSRPVKEDKLRILSWKKDHNVRVWLSKCTQVLHIYSQIFHISLHSELWFEWGGVQDGKLVKNCFVRLRKILRIIWCTRLTTLGRCKRKCLFCWVIAEIAIRRIGCLKELYKLSRIILSTPIISNMSTTLTITEFEMFTFFNNEVHLLQPQDHFWPMATLPIMSTVSTMSF